MDLILRGGRIDGFSELVDIGIDGGKFAAIAPRLARAAGRSISAAALSRRLFARATSISTSHAFSPAAKAKKARWKKRSPKSRCKRNRSPLTTSTSAPARR
jgi:hypothetical protein